AARAAQGKGALLGIVQGGGHEAWGRRAVEETCAHDLPGYAIGGLAVGETKALLYEITALVAGLLPADRPRYLMGVGKPTDLVEAGARGGGLFPFVLAPPDPPDGEGFTSERTPPLPPAP